MIGNIYITGQIGDFDGFKGVELLDVMKQVKQYPDATAYNVYIDSEGGIVDTGFDIYNYLVSLNKPITTIGVRMVASIATVIFMAGSTRQVQPGTQFMIHLPWDMVSGNSYELKWITESLEAYDKKLIDFYKKSLDIQEEGILPLLKNETWLNEEQLKTLGFINSEPVKVTAIAKLKPNNKMEGNTEEQKTFLAKVEQKIDALLTKLNLKPKAKVVQDGTGTSIDFTDLSDEDAIQVGQMATVDGAPANGEFTMPNGDVYVFANGELTEIREAGGDEELAATKAENEALKQEIETLKASISEKETTIADVAKEVTALKAQVKSNFKIETKEEKPKGKNDETKVNTENRFEGILEKVKQLKKK